MDGILATCGRWTSGRRDDKFFGSFLKTLAKSGFLKADLTTVMRLLGSTATARVHITSLSLEDSEADQVKLNSKEFSIEGVQMRGKLVYNGDDYDVELTAALGKGMSYNLDDLSFSVREVSTEPDLPEGVKDMLMASIGDVFKENIAEEVDETKVQLEEEGVLTASESGSESAGAGEPAGGDAGSGRLGCILAAVLVVLAIVGACAYFIAFRGGDPSDSPSVGGAGGGGAGSGEEPVVA